MTMFNTYPYTGTTEKLVAPTFVDVLKDVLAPVCEGALLRFESTDMFNVFVYERHFSVVLDALRRDGRFILTATRTPHYKMGMPHILVSPCFQLAQSLAR